MSHTPSKRWGQNFLRDFGTAERIVALLNALPGETIVEIGPGRGALTQHLSRLSRRVLAVEIDPQLAIETRRRFNDPIHVVLGDATCFAWPRLPWRAIGNLPYNAATPIVREIASNDHLVKAIFMVQKEVAERIVAAAGSDDYGFLSIAVQLWCDARIAFHLPPGAFHPQPKIWSSIVVLDPVARSFQSSRESLLELASASFRMRRKTLVNNLIGFRGASRSTLEDALDAIQLSRSIRAEMLSLEELDRLNQRLGSDGEA